MSRLRLQSLSQLTEYYFKPLQVTVSEECSTHRHALVHFYSFLWISSCFNCFPQKMVVHLQLVIWLLKILGSLIIAVPLALKLQWKMWFALSFYKLVFSGFWDFLTYLHSFDFKTYKTHYLTDYSLKIYVGSFVPAITAIYLNLKRVKSP